MTRPHYPTIEYRCVSPHLVEKRAVCYGNTQGSEASANHHVVGGVITVAAAATGHEPGHRHPAEDHSAGGTQSVQQRYTTLSTGNMWTTCRTQGAKRGGHDKRRREKENVYHSGMELEIHHNYSNVF